MYPFRANGSRAIAISYVPGHIPRFRLLTVVLSDLIARWLILVEIMFSIEATGMLNITIECYRSAKCRK